MGINRNRHVAMVGFLAALCLAGCSGSANATNAWDGLNPGGDESGIQATGVPEPADFESLVEQTDEAVRGTVIEVNGGPDDVAEFHDKAAPVAVLVVSVSYASDPALEGTEIRVIAARDPDVTIASLDAELAGQEAMFYIDKSSMDGYWNKAWSQSILIDGPRGVEVAGNRGNASLVPDNVEDLDDVQHETERLVN